MTDAVRNFYVALEAILRTSNTPASRGSDTRLAPIKPPVSPAKDLQQLLPPEETEVYRIPSWGVRL
jgi:hypothetical protein